ncbi:MAG: homoserine O-succinyltransferase [Candidatus Saccharibacteria bacterium]|nr:homoserine O-succinyltransferase [Candidatus Saccharibacteria bacterium]
MPIVTPEYSTDTHLFERLQDCGAIVIDQEEAETQDIRPAKIGLLNLMPAQVMEATELRWLRFISHTVLQIEPVLLKFDDDKRELPNSSRRNVLKRYHPFSAATEDGLDGLIVTGDNQERQQDGTPLPMNELHYAEDLKEVIDWANSNISASIYSCLASHYALNYQYGLCRDIKNRKFFGVYDHHVMKESEITFAMDDLIRAPHSRWGTIATEHLEAAGLDVLAVSEEAGWLIAEDVSLSGNTNTYLQGHPEYWRYDLHDEYVRDRQYVPENYYPGDNPELQPILSWSGDARSLLSNWIQGIYKSYSS